MNTVTADQPVIKRYIVGEVWKDYEVTLEVNHTRLTPEIATMINNFWGGSDDRLADSDGDIVKTIIRLFGLRMINMMLSQGGAFFGLHYKNPITNEHPGKYWSAELQNEEGWGEAGGDPYGWCGIRVIAADVEVPGFDDVALAEVGL